MKQKTRFKANALGREIEVKAKVWTDSQGTFRWKVTLSGDSL